MTSTDRSWLLVTLSGRLGSAEFEATKLRGAAAEADERTMRTETKEELLSLAGAYERDAAHCRRIIDWIEKDMFTVTKLREEINNKKEEIDRLIAENKSLRETMMTPTGRMVPPFGHFGTFGPRVADESPEENHLRNLLTHGSLRPNPTRSALAHCAAEEIKTLRERVAGMGTVSMEEHQEVREQRDQAFRERDELRVDLDATDASLKDEIAVRVKAEQQRDEARESDEKARMYSAELQDKAHLRTLLDLLRGRGWTVAAHNDYRIGGAAHTFWLFTHPEGRWVKGEGKTDIDALKACREAIGTDGDEVYEFARTIVAREPPNGTTPSLAAILHAAIDYGYFGPGDEGNPLVLSPRGGDTKAWEFRSAEELHEAWEFIDKQRSKR